MGKGHTIDKQRTNECFFFVSCSFHGEDITLQTDWQGCSNLFLESPLHICEIEDFVKTLRDMTDQAREYFDGEFGVGCLTPDMVKTKLEKFL